MNPGRSGEDSTKKPLKPTRDDQKDDYRLKDKVDPERTKAGSNNRKKGSDFLSTSLSWSSRRIEKNNKRPRIEIYEQVQGPGAS
jgi:hypothetical protein